MIHFQDIQFRYEGTISSEIGVKDINLIVHTGECVLLCGRSGCGKTTLTKLINGLIPNYFPGELSGNVQIDDENILGMPMYYLATKVGSVFQNPRTQFFNVDVDSEIGNAEIKSWQQARFAAASTSSWVASGFPNLMLFSIESWKRYTF